MTPEPRGKDKLTADDPIGWYELEMSDGIFVARWWDGHGFRYHREGKKQMEPNVSYPDVKSIRPLAPASQPLSDDERQERERLMAENANLRNRLLSAAGDDLCRLSQEEIKAYSSGAVKIPPKAEFLPSCERFWEQTAKESGVLEGCLTLAQLIAENAKLQSELAQARAEAAEVNKGTDRLRKLWDYQRDKVTHQLLKNDSLTKRAEAAEAAVLKLTQELKCQDAGVEAPASLNTSKT